MPEGGGRWVGSNKVVELKKKRSTDRRSSFFLLRTQRGGSRTPGGTLESRSEGVGLASRRIFLEPGYLPALQGPPWSQRHSRSGGARKPENKQRPVMCTAIPSCALTHLLHTQHQGSCWARSPAGFLQREPGRCRPLPRGPPCSTEVGVAQDEDREPQMMMGPITLCLKCLQGLRVASSQSQQGGPKYLIPFPTWVLIIPHTHEPSEKRFTFFKSIY